MYDMNFFSATKNKKSGNRSFLTFLIILLVVFIVLNGLMIGAAYFKFGEIERDIESKAAFLTDPATQQKVADANKARVDVDLTNQYLAILKQADNKLNQITLINTALIDHIRKLTPATTQITTSSISGNIINLTCISTIDTDPLDMYHAFLHDERFITASLSTVTMQVTMIPTPEVTPDPENPDEAPDETGDDQEPVDTEIRTYSFSIMATLATGGDQE